VAAWADRVEVLEAGGPRKPSLRAVRKGEGGRTEEGRGRREKKGEEGGGGRKVRRGAEGDSKPSNRRPNSFKVSWQYCRSLGEKVNMGDEGFGSAKRETGKPPEKRTCMKAAREGEHTGWR
jgi:hypothetical protein